MVIAVYCLFCAEVCEWCSELWGKGPCKSLTAQGLVGVKDKQLLPFLLNSKIILVTHARPKEWHSSESRAVLQQNFCCMA